MLVWLVVWGFEGRIYQVRFKPRVGQFLAAPTGSVVSLFDVETDRQQMHTFQGHCRGTLRLLGYKWRLFGVCGHLHLGSAFMNLIQVETCIILVFFSPKLLNSVGYWKIPPAEFLPI